MAFRIKKRKSGTTGWTVWYWECIENPAISGEHPDKATAMAEAQEKCGDRFDIGSIRVIKGTKGIANPGLNSCDSCSPKISSRSSSADFQFLLS
jgi:hypothetical protein